jgi:hypothetical protein
MRSEYEEHMATQIESAHAQLAQFVASAKAKGADAEVAIINNLTAAKQTLDQKLKDLKTTKGSRVAGARADLEADVAAFKASIEELAVKLKN